MRGTRVLLLVASAVVFGACTNFARQNNPPAHVMRSRPAEYRVAIILFPDRISGGCQSLTTPAYLPVGRNDTLTFQVVNLCSNTERIEVKDFLGNDVNNHDPVDADPGNDPSNPDKPIKFKVKGAAPYDVYKYAIYRGGQKVEDPEIDVER